MSGEIVYPHEDLMGTYPIPEASEPFAELICGAYNGHWRVSGRPVAPHSGENIVIVDALDLFSRPYMVEQLERAGYNDKDEARVGYANVGLIHDYLEFMIQYFSLEEGLKNLRDRGMKEIEIDAALELTHVKKPAAGPVVNYDSYGRKITENAGLLKVEHRIINPFVAPVKVGDTTSNTRIDPAPAGSKPARKAPAQVQLGEDIMTELEVTDEQREAVDAKVIEFQVVRNQQIKDYKQQFEAHQQSKSA